MCALLGAREQDVTWTRDGEGGATRSARAGWWAECRLTAGDERPAS